jgi:hypothetical protein
VNEFVSRVNSDISYSDTASLGLIYIKIRISHSQGLLAKHSARANFRCL